MGNDIFMTVERYGVPYLMLQIWVDADDPPETCRWKIMVKTGEDWERIGVVSREPKNQAISNGLDAIKRLMIV